MKRLGGICFLALLGSLLSSAAGAGAQSPTSITVSPSDPTLKVGNTLQFSAQSDSTFNLGLGGAIAAGDGHTCALQADGTVMCWGNNAAGQLGDGTSSNRAEPLPVAGLTGVKAIVAGAYHTCALLGDGTVKCWGSNSAGQLGDGTTTDAHTPVAASGLSAVKAIAAGTYHTCALLSNGTLQCWGYNNKGQLGNGATSTTPVTSPGTVQESGGSALGGATALAAGAFHTCALLSDGTAKCWGQNFYGQLGNETTTDSATPVGVSGLTGESPEARATAIFSSQSSLHTCVLVSDGTAECWGGDADGQLGDGTTTSSSIPLPVNGLSGAVALATGEWQTCALLSDSTMKCWGNNLYGQLGDGTTSRKLLPVHVLESGGSNLSGVTAIVAGSIHTCALLSDGTAKCWGDNYSGKLGDGTAMGRTMPVAVVGTVLPGAGASHIAVGDQHTCATLADGTGKCWGDNSFQQLGDTTRDRSLVPVTVYDLSAATAIALGSEHSCALLAEGTAECWGNSGFGQMGTGYTGDQGSQPTAVVSLSEAKAIAARSDNTCALIADGTMKCWGANGVGQVGNGDHSPGEGTPATVVGKDNVGYLSGVKAMAVGMAHACAVLADGTAMCWGRNFEGQLGNGTTSSATWEDQSTPVAVSGLTGAIAIAAGDAHTCALLADGTVKCWGLNDYGQLGNGATSTTPQTTPIAVSGLSGVIAIAAGSDYTIALLDDAKVMGWGNNMFTEVSDANPHPVLTSPAWVGIMGPAKAIAAGMRTTCGLITDGTAMCWGFGMDGQLGIGTRESSMWPTTVKPLVTSVAWASDMAGVATIDAASGLATAVALGSATITATYGTLTADTNLLVIPLSSPPTATNVSIAGTPNVGSELTGNYTYGDLDGDLEGASTFRWLREGTAIDGATSSTYTPVAADAGHAITFEVTPVAQSGLSPGEAATSAGVTINSAPTATGVSIAGAPNVGSPLTGNYTYSDVNGDAEGASTFRWLRDGTAIAEATSSTYTPVSADAGHVITFEVTPAAQTGTSPGEAATSAGVTIDSAPTATGVSIAGTPNVGSELTGNYTYGDANDDAEGASTFRWLRDGAAIAGATSKTYTPVSADAGHTVTFEVTPVAQTGTSPGEAATSAGVTINSAPTATGVSIAGTPNVGSELTGNYTYSDVNGDAEGASTFRWLRDGAAIAGATSKTYTPVSADAGHTITFEVTPVAQTGTSPGVAATSAGVTINSAPTATTVYISGMPVAGATLTGHYTYSDAEGDAEGASTFRWLRDGAAIAGATNKTYTLISADAGHAIAFEVTPVAQTGTSPGVAATSAGAAITSLESIAVTPANPTLVAGATLQLAATGTYSGGSGDVTNIVRWTSSRPKSVTIASDGLATAVKAGTATIVASWGSISGSTVATVGGAALNAIAVTPANGTVSVGKSLQFTATGTYSDGSQRAITTLVTWTSSDTSAATISSTGAATGIAVGASTISATLGAVSGSTTLTVAKVLVSIGITPANPSIRVLQSTQLTATGAYSDASTADITNAVAWSSSKPSVATVNAGLVTGNAPGRASIKAKLGGVTASTTAIVTP